MSERLVLSEGAARGTAGQWQLIWARFKRHRLGVAGGLIILIFYVLAVFANFIAPYDPQARSIAHLQAPPTRVRIRDSEGSFRRPFVYGTLQERDSVTFGLSHVVDTSVRYPIRLFARSDPYAPLGLFETDVHLFGTGAEQRVYLLGTDTQGRDLFSRIIHGSRVSLSIGLVGVAISFGLGIVIGAFSGYVGGATDLVIQRVIEVLISIPSLPLWMALSAAIPLSWTITQVFFAITVILSLMGWPGMAREVRGKFLSLREEAFVESARLDGAKRWRVMTRHMVPSFLSHLIARATLAIPGMILGETALSFLGIGLRAPAISWGVLLKSAQNVTAVASIPWVLTPGLFVIVVVLAFNFFGDGIRDAADPYTE